MTAEDIARPIGVRPKRPRRRAVATGPEPSVYPATSGEARSQPCGPWLTVAQVTAYLDFPSEGAVRELERRGVLPGHRLGGSLRFSRPELDALILAGRRAAAAEVVGGVPAPTVPSGGLGPFLGTAKAAAYLGLPSEEALLQRVRRGGIPAYRVGRLYRFRAAELDAALRVSRRLPRGLPPVAGWRLTSGGRFPTPVGRRPFAERKGG